MRYYLLTFYQGDTDAEMDADQGQGLDGYDGGEGAGHDDDDGAIAAVKKRLLVIVSDFFIRSLKKTRRRSKRRITRSTGRPNSRFQRTS
jgi:hypothetical protein